MQKEKQSLPNKVVSAVNKHHYEAASQIADQLAQEKIQSNSSVNGTIQNKSLSDFGPLKERYLD